MCSRILIFGENPRQTWHEAAMSIVSRSRVASALHCFTCELAHLDMCPSGPVAMPPCSSLQHHGFESDQGWSKHLSWRERLLQGFFGFHLMLLTWKVDFHWVDVRENCCSELRLKTKIVAIWVRLKTWCFFWLWRCRQLCNFLQTRQGTRSRVIFFFLCIYFFPFRKPQRSFRWLSMSACRRSCPRKPASLLSILGASDGEVVAIHVDHSRALILATCKIFKCFQSSEKKHVQLLRCKVAHLYFSMKLTTGRIIAYQKLVLLGTWSTKKVLVRTLLFSVLEWAALNWCCPRDAKAISFWKTNWNHNSPPCEKIYEPAISPSLLSAPVILSLGRFPNLLIVKSLFVMVNRLL